MFEVFVNIDETKRGTFVLEQNHRNVGEMKVYLEGNNLIVESTWVDEEMRGKNIGKKLLDAMVLHARKNNYKIVPICPFVRGQFKNYPEDYKDIWKKIA